MKPLYIFLIIISAFPAHFMAQSPDITSMLIYRKKHDAWQLWMKKDIVRTTYMQSNTGYRWIDEQWKLTSVHAREVSLNRDTIQTWITNYNDIPPKKKVSTKCYAIRDSAGNRIDAMFEIQGVLYPSWEPRLGSLDSMPGGQPLAYPYQHIFDEAAKQLALGQSEENIHPAFIRCAESDRPDEVFNLTFDDQQQVVAFESDSSKVIVIYQQDTGHPEEQPYQLLYPNPFLDALYIEAIDPSVERITVMNYTGQTVHAASILPGQANLEINLPSAPAGIYVVNLISGSTTHSNKVVKIE